MPKISKVVLVVGLGLLPHLAGVLGRPYPSPSFQSSIDAAMYHCDDSDGVNLGCPVAVSAPAQQWTDQHSAPEILMVLVNSLSVSGDDLRLIPDALPTDKPSNMYTEEEAVIQEFMRQTQLSDQIFTRTTPFGNYGLANDLKEILKQMKSFESPSPNFRLTIAAVAQFAKDTPEHIAERTPYNQVVFRFMLYNLKAIWGAAMTEFEQFLLSTMLADTKSVFSRCCDVFKFHVSQFYGFLAAKYSNRPDQMEAVFASINQDQALTMFIFNHFLRVDVDHEGQQDVMELFNSLASSNFENAKNDILSTATLTATIESTLAL
ncbi:hypothetical protein H4R34_001750 [Dimargaris verticillata]|uniref:Uncharacterized protein n=1 Tax=Dimargaris verticillata TaxID=2761393 RepID=A0A9W8EEP7_9FUNG|nr:hypothetical protein H4R34_001750 [Dimargaris verticillata]